MFEGLLHRLAVQSNYLKRASEDLYKRHDYSCSNTCDEAAGEIDSVSEQFLSSFDAALATKDAQLNEARMQLKDLRRKLQAIGDQCLETADRIGEAIKAHQEPKP